MPGDVWMDTDSDTDGWSKQDSESICGLLLLLSETLHVQNLCTNETNKKKMTKEYSQT